MSHSKAFGMTNLGYKIRIPQKIYNRATITEKVYYENYWNRLYQNYSMVRVNQRLAVKKVRWNLGNYVKVNRFTISFTTLLDTNLICYG